MAGGAILLDVAIATLLVRLGHGLLAVAWASLAAYLLFTLANLTYVHDHFRSSSRERVAFLVRAFLPGAYSTAVILAVDARFRGRLGLSAWPLPCS